MTGGAWRMLVMLAMLALLSFLSVGPVDAQDPCGNTCDSRAGCYHSIDRGWYCACDGYYTGNGYSCRYSTWRVILYIIFSVLGAILIFFLCLSCLGYRRRQEQPVGYPMQPMGNPPYGYPPPPAPTQATANPAMYSYPPQTGYPVNAYPPQVVHQPNGKVPGPSGTV